MVGIISRWESNLVQLGVHYIRMGDGQTAASEMGLHVKWEGDRGTGTQTDIISV